MHFHEYAVAWDESAVTWILDGREHHRLTPADVPGPWPFDHPFYLLVNLAIGGDWPGNDGDPALPAVLLVDWIRAGKVAATVYQRPLTQGRLALQSICQFLQKRGRPTSDQRVSLVL